LGIPIRGTQKWPVPEEAPFCLNVDLFPKAEIRNEFLQVIANNKQGSDQDEPLCLQYVYGESVDKPDTFHFHEQYSGANGGKEGFDAHTQAPHFAAWEAFASTGEPFTQPPVVYFFKAL
jgi:quinol monooxygenase YgiN